MATAIAMTGKVVFKSDRGYPGTRLKVKKSGGSYRK